MFKARDGYSIVGGDFSQQEPRLLSHYSGDESMINAYKEGKDLYATMAAQVHGNGYWDNMEHHEDGTPNPEGKKRRGQIKSVVLGILYGRGAASVAEQIGSTPEEAQELINKFYSGFPKVKAWIDQTKADAHKKGYVEDVVGRRRRLPDILLPRYTVKLKNEEKYVDLAEFNPLLGTSSSFTNKDHPLVAKYKRLTEGLRGQKDYLALQEQALDEGVELHNNTGFISQAERQSVNSRVQGGAASITKIAMINVAKDPEMQRLGFKILICVHDEIIGECPRENAEAAGQRLSQIMIDSAATVCSVRMKCDTYCISRWYIDDFSDMIQEKYQKAVSSGEDPLLAQQHISEKYSMINPTLLREMMLGTFECNKYSYI